MAGKNKTELALEFGLAMNEMKSLLRQRIQAKINEYDASLSFELLEIIGLLWRRDGITQQEIATIVSKDKSSMTYLINSLSKRKLVKRMEHETDRRNKRIFLTEKGKKIRKIIYPWVLELYAQAAGNVSEAEIRKAFLLVKKMTGNLS